MQQKELWIAEKPRREAWKELKLKELKEITIKGLEPHIEGIVEVGSSQSGPLAQWFCLNSGIYYLRLAVPKFTLLLRSFASQVCVTLSIRGHKQLKASTDVVVSVIERSLCRVLS
jgi:hypothetical protein